MRSRLIFALLAALPLCSQGVYDNVDKPGDPICPKIEMQNDPSIAYGQGGYGQGANRNDARIHQEDHVFFTPGERKDVSAFTAYDERGKGLSVASLKGKMIVIGFWGTRCDPSTRMLMEMAQLSDRRARFGFETLAVNFDANRLTEDSRIPSGWVAVKRFQQDNRPFLQAHPITFYIPGTGKEGASNFVNEVQSLPLLAVVDRNGKLASLDIGYTPKLVAHRLSQLIKEEQAAKAVGK